MKAVAGNRSNNNSDDPAMQKEKQQRHEERMYAELKAQEILDLPPDQRYEAIMKLSPEERRAMAGNLKNEDRQHMLNDLTPQQRETRIAMNNPQPLVEVEPQQQRQRRGLNENYAREIMELHTLGVDGGYTQKDVTELARVLTGWTIEQPQRGGDFTFNERMHEPGTKTVLGETFKEDGKREGERAIEMLAKHPATAKFISRKLAMRFVSDNPSPALVDRMAQTFLNSDGDIREVLRTLFKSPEFWAADSYRAKVKTPLEFVVSAIRATNADVNNALPLAQNLNRMGMPLYGMQPPTGYSMKQEP